MLSIVSPFPQYTDKSGDPLDAGYVYIGAVSTNPETNPITVYWDDAGTQEAAQPIRTINGYLSRNGSPARLFTSEIDFSITVLDKRRGLVFYEKSAQSISTLSGPGGALLVGTQALSDVTAAVRSLADRLDDSLDIRAYGAKGDGSTDDTAALQKVINKAIFLGLTIVDNKGGVFVTGPLDFNGTGHAEPANTQWQALKGFRGAGRMSTVFVAKAGAYTSGDWIVKARNTAATSYQGFGFNGLGIAQQGFDFSWTGGQGGDPNTAPSNQSIYRDIYGEGVTGWGFNFDQVHDSVIDGIWSRGVSSGNTAFTFRGAGGQIGASRIYASTGRVVMSCQNGGFTDCGFFGGYEITGSGFNAIVHNNVHFYPDPTTSILIRSSATGTAPNGLVFNACFGNPTPGWVFGGNFWNGAVCNGCLWQNAASGFYATIVPLAGPGDPPLFVYNHNTFYGTSFPGDVANQVASSHCKSKTNSGSSFTSLRIPGIAWADNLRVGRGTPYSVEQATFHSPTGPDTATAAFGSPAGVSAIIYAQAGAAANAASSTIRANASAATNRSFSGGGTVNVAGADYAEYHTVIDRIAGSVAAGQIIGFDANDQVTDVWSDAVGGFGIKSTDPSFVGGDRWAAGLNAEENPAAYEAARRRVDRIAYSGRVPVNVQGAAPGDYIVAAQGPGNSIVGVVVKASEIRADMTRYLLVVGRVRSILPDGRASCAVVVH